MALRNIFTESVILPLSDKLQKQKITSYLKFLMKSQGWSKDRIEAYQNERLRRLIEHSYENVDYYNQLFKKLDLFPSDIKTKEDLQKLPILTKSIIKENVANGKLIARNINKKKLLKNSSSGSTGEPLQYFETKASYSMNIASNLRGWYNMGYRLGDRYLKLSVNPRGSKIKRIQDKINNCLYFLSKGIDKDDIQRFITLVKNRKPKVLRGYPSTLSVIANYIIDNNIEIKGVQFINTTGEILFAEMKVAMETAFNAKVFDSYSGEGGANMFQDLEGIYHISHEYAITEILDQNCNNIIEGIGEIVSTDLWNYANPFIRYAVNDSIEIYPEKTNNSAMRAKRILGRNVDMLKTPKGKVLIVHFFTGYFEWISTVKQFQIRQDSDKDFVLNLVVNNEFTDSKKIEIYEHVQKYMGKDVNLKLAIVDSISSQVNGKTRFMLKNY
jgi:phenylacetate-CoA ligase